MPHLPPTHHETSKCDLSNETKIKVKQSNHPEFEFKHRQVIGSSQSMKELTTWFLNLPFDESIDNKGTKFEF
jgi:hypothetical protein